MNPRYLVIEIQTNADGSIGSVQSQSFSNPDERLKAESRYHTILAAAANSTKPIHAAMMLTADGFLMESKCYTHEVEPEPTPEPEQTEAE